MRQNGPEVDVVDSENAIAEASPIIVNKLDLIPDHSSSAQLLVSAAKRAGATSEGVALDPEERRLAGVNMSVKLVLMSTDDQFCILVRSYLQHLGFCVFTCTSSVRAERQFLERCDIDVWLVDGEALGIGALHFAARVRDLHAEVPIVLLSGVCQNGADLQWLLRQNWVSMRKPIQLPDLLATIHHALASVPRKPSMIRQRGDRGSFGSDWTNKLSQNPMMN
jgi:two-component system, chemotaxis family, chemotaxis protein CheY